MQGARPIYIYIGLHLALKILAKESIKHFLSNIWRMYHLFVTLNLKNKKYMRLLYVLSSLSKMATNWLQ